MTSYFPLQVVPYEDELISSWLVRLSLGNGIDPMTLSNIYWPKKRPWTTDIDRNLGGLSLAGISQSASIDEGTIMKMMLKNHFRKLDNNLNPLAVWNWLIPFGKRNREIKTSLQYCPKCLQEKKYFKTYWRMAWYNVCHLHGIKLNESCPGCDAPINIHKISIEHEKISFCFKCGFNLEEADFLVATDEDAKSINYCLSTFKNNFHESDDYKYTSLEWFSLLRFLVTLVQLAAVSERQDLGSLLKCLNIKIDEVKRSYLSLRFEMLSNERRLNVLNYSIKPMEMDLESISSVFSRMGIGEKEILSWGIRAPQLVSNLLNFKPHSVSSIRKPRSKTTHKIKSAKKVMREHHLLLRKHGIKID